MRSSEFPGTQEAPRLLWGTDAGARVLSFLSDLGLEWYEARGPEDSTKCLLCAVPATFLMLDSCFIIKSRISKFGPEAGVSVSQSGM